jgi:hypothetical protein
MGEGQEASEGGDGITGVSPAPASITNVDWSPSTTIRKKQKQKTNRRPYCNLAYSALAAMRMGMSRSASFQRVRKS